MKTFNYIVKDEVGIHARPAGMLVKEAGKYESKIVIKKEAKEADASRLMAVMSLGVKCGEEVTVEITGADEEIASQELEEFFKANL